MRIIGIVGVLDRPLLRKIWRHLEAEFKRQFPDAEWVVEFEHYFPWQIEKMRAYRDRLLARYDTGEEVIFIGHSMGGVIGTAIAPQFKHSRVRGIVTIYSPHRFLFGLFTAWLRFKALHSVIPVISAGARCDYSVWWGSKHPEAVKHLTFWSDHIYGLILRQSIAKRLAEEARRAFY